MIPNKNKYKAALNDYRLSRQVKFIQVEILSLKKFSNLSKMLILPHRKLVSLKKLKITYLKKTSLLLPHSFKKGKTTYLSMGDGVFPDASGNWTEVINTSSTCPESPESSSRGSDYFLQLLSSFFGS